MQTNQKCTGFTLIELLVVVLIIGILAAVALPQYEKAVEKSRQAEAWTTLASIQQAMEIAEMEKGGWAQWEDLSLQFVDKNGSIVDNTFGSAFETENWFFSYMDASWVDAFRKTGPDAGYTLSLRDKQKCCYGDKAVCGKYGAKTSTTVPCSWGTGYPF